MKIVFLGTPRFAVFSLKALVNAGLEVPLVVTQPDRPKGRGMQTVPTPVKTWALEQGLRVIQAEKIDTELVDEIRGTDPDLIAVSAFGLFLPRKLCRAARLACINVHPSLLPAYRGAAPVQWAVINGERTTGVSIMHVAPKLDAGAIILQEPEPILDVDTAETLMERLAQKGGDLLVRAVDLFAKGQATAQPQDENRVTWARALRKEDGRIDWTQPAGKVRDLVRGVVPWPGAFTELPDGRRMKVFPQVESIDGQGQPGELFRTGKRVAVYCGTGAVILSMVQLPGKKKVDPAALVNGGVLKPGMRLSI